jgi:predicted ATPase
VTNTVVLTGPPGAGKTTLARRLVAEAGARMIPEAATMVVDRFEAAGVSGYRGTEWFQRAVERTDAVMESRLDPEPGEKVVLDRALADNVAFRRALGHPVPEAVLSAVDSAYDHAFVLDPVSGGDGDCPAGRDRLTEAIEEAYGRAASEVHTVPAASTPRRASMVIDAAWWER